MSQSIKEQLAALRAAVSLLEQLMCERDTLLATAEMVLADVEQNGVSSLSGGTLRSLRAAIKLVNDLDSKWAAKR